MGHSVTVALPLFCPDRDTVGRKDPGSSAWETKGSESKVLVFLNMKYLVDANPYLIILKGTYW